MAPGKSIIFIEQNSQVQVELGTESNLIGIFFWKQVNVRTDVHFRGNFTRARKCNLIGPRQGMPHSTAQALSLESKWLQELFYYFFWLLFLLAFLPTR